MRDEYWVCEQCEYGVSGSAYSPYMTNLLNKHENETGHTMVELTDAG